MLASEKSLSIYSVSAIVPVIVWVKLRVSPSAAKALGIKPAPASMPAVTAKAKGLFQIFLANLFVHDLYIIDSPLLETQNRIHTTKSSSSHAEAT